MLSKGFKIYDKKRFDLYIENVQCEKNQAIVKIDKACICKADIRYYLGNRDKKILSSKYPMNLIHEAIGIITKDLSNTFKVGDRVALVPNLILNDCKKCKYKHCSDSHLGENYCPSAKFASSNCDGFSKEYVNYPIKNLVKINDIDFESAVFLELISVANASIRRVNINDSNVISIWGDGILGYILCCVLRGLFKGKIIAIGKHKEKLCQFPSDEKILLEDLSSNINFDLAFECVGGMAMGSAISNIVDHMDIGGKLILTGVAETNVEIDTRKILEKGLAIYGVTRSTVADFKQAKSFLKNENFKDKINKLILDKLEIKTINDFYYAFENEINNKNLGKNILEFKF